MGTTIVCVSGSNAGVLREKLLTLINYGLPSTELYNSDDSCIVAIVANQGADLRNKLGRALELLKTGKDPIEEKGIYYQPSPFGSESVAFVFPGQGSQSIGMLHSLRERLPFFEAHLQAINARYQERYRSSILDVIYREKTAANEENLRDTRQAQLALGLVSISLAQALRDLDVKPSYAAGHSYGELPALHTAGIVNTDFLLQMSMVRGQLMGDAGDKFRGAMLSVFAEQDIVGRLISDHGIEAVISIVNADEQMIVSGSLAAINTLEQVCAGKIKTIRLKTSAAFHSPLMAEAEKKWRDFITAQKDEFHDKYEVKVYSNVTAQAYQLHQDMMLELLASQLTHRVRWQETCNQLYADGARIFVEVGPANVLTNLMTGILTGKPHLTLHTDPRHKDGLEHMCHFIGKLASHHVKVNVWEFFDERIYRDFISMGTERKSGMNHGNESNRQLVFKQYLKSNQWMVRTFLEEQNKIIAEQLRSMIEPDKPKLMELIRKQRKSVLLGALEAQRVGLSSFFSEVGHVQPILESHETAALDTELAAKQVAAAMETDYKDAERETPPFTPEMKAQNYILRLTEKIAVIAAKPLNEITLITGFDKLNIDIFALANIYDSMFSSHDRYKLFKRELLHAPNLGQVEKLLCYMVTAGPDSTKGELINSHLDYSSDTADIERYGFTYEPVVSSEKNKSAPTRLLLVGMKNKMFDLFKGSLAAQGIHIAEIHITETGWDGFNPNGGMIGYDDVKGLQDYMERFLDDKGSLPSLLFLVPDSESILEHAHFEAWNARIEQTAVALYIMSDIYGKTKGNSESPSWFSVVGENGLCPVGAAVRGIVRTMAHDFKGKYQIRSIWLDISYRQTNFQQLLKVMNEGISTHDMFIRADDIYVRKLKALEVGAQNIEAALNPSSLVIFFGGGVGITAEIACAVAERFGCRIVIVGRTSFPTNIAYEHIQEESVLKKEIFRDLSLKLKDGQKITGNMLEHEAKKIYRQRALIRSKQRIERTGSEFHYYSCDISDHEALNALLLDIEKQHGKVTGIVHGAGEMNSQRNKTAKAFGDNLSIKTSSMFALYQFFRKYPLKFAILFSSISAYTGLPRQSDYSSSNEFVNSIASHWNKQVDYPVRSIMWSLWTETGIMKNSTKDVEKLGLRGITNKQGIQLFMRELDHLESSDECVMLTHDTMLKFSMP